MLHHSSIGFYSIAYAVMYAISIGKEEMWSFYARDCMYKHYMQKREI